MNIPTSADTNYLIDELRKRKKKLDKKEQQLKVMYFIFIAISIIGVAYILITLTQLELYQPLDLFSAFLNQSLAVFTLLLLISLKLYINILSKAEKEAEKKYESLRAEVIDYLHTSPYWLISKHSEKKDNLTDLLDKEGINLRHKAK